MIDFAIHRMDFKNAMEVYPRLRIDDSVIPSYIYMAFWEQRYAGYMAGTIFDMNTIEIKATQLVPERRGKSTARAVREIVKSVHRDFYRVLIKVENYKVDMLRILLGAGFKVIGARQFDGNLSVELQSTNEQVM